MISYITLDKDKKYFSIGEYIQKVEVLKEKELISSGSMTNYY